MFTGRDWCWSWSSNTLATWCEELTHWKRPWSWERLRAGGEGGDRGWDGWMDHWLNGHEFKQSPGDSEGQGSLVCCSPWGCKDWMTEQQQPALNWTWYFLFMDPVTHPVCFFYSINFIFFLRWERSRSGGDVGTQFCFLNQGFRQSFFLVTFPTSPCLQKDPGILIVNHCRDSALSVMLVHCFLYY